MMYKIDDKQYDFKYTTARLLMIERALNGKSIMGILTSSNGVLSLEQIQVFFAYGLLGEDGIYIPVKQGMDFALEQMEKTNFAKLNSDIVKALQRDCPFLFRAD